MAKKNFQKLPKCLWIAIPFLAVILWAIYLIARPYFDWQTKTIDDFVSISYPKDWYFQTEGYKTLSKVEYLFLLSDYKGELSRQDASSEDQKFLIEGNRISKADVSDMDEFARPFLNWCKNFFSDQPCDMSVLRYEKSDRKIIKINVRAKGQSFFNDEYFLFIEGDKYFYEIHAGYFAGPGSVSDFLRQKILDKIIESVEIKTK